MNCIISVLTCVCGRLAEAFGSSVQAQAEGGFSFLGRLAGRAFWDRILEWQNRVVWVPEQTTTIIGAEETLKAIRSLLTGDEVDIVGVVGMGGVGKTTLLKEINNDLFLRGTGKFDIVIFATVSREANPLKVQKQIGGRLGLPEISDRADLNRTLLYNCLSKKRFLLLLDDVWGELDLMEIGIPLPTKLNRCKMALTTRSSAVFGRILGTWCQRRQRARTVKVSPLDDARSWELFWEMIDAVVDLHDPSIRPHAEWMVQKCGGLPLALVTMGRAMAAATSPAQWRMAKGKLEESAYRLEGMDNVYTNLVFSIDMLEEGRLLPCFLYCSLFPEDYNIPEEQLIECWIGEGFLDDACDERPRRRGKGVDRCIYRARDKGQVVIEQLKALHLLETGNSEDQHRCVKMHDLVREVALVLGNMEPNQFLVHATECPPDDDGSRRAIQVDGWEEATRVSLMNCSIEEGSLPEMPLCPKGSTLLMHNVTLPRELPDGFFTSMHSLVVLDLSRANCVTRYSNVYLRTLPTSICLLQGLQYLNLSWTAIHSLPKELGNLGKLRQLDLSETHRLEEIPQQAISRLSSMQVLNMKQSRYTWGREGSDVHNINDHDDRQLYVSDLYGLERLQDISIDIQSLANTELLSRGPSLLRSITRLGLVNISDLTTGSLLSALQGMVSLRELQIRNCKNLTGELILDGSVPTPVLCQLELLVLWHVPLSAIVIRGGNEEEGGVGGGTRKRSADGLPLQKLRCLHVCWCSTVKDINWVAQLRLLEVINVSGCYRMEELLSHVNTSHTCAGQASKWCGGGGRGRWSTLILPKLRSLTLTNLPKLRSICDPPSQCPPSLEFLHVIHCPLLRTLPLGSDSKIIRIEGDGDWWERVEWTREQRDVRRVARAAFHTSRRSVCSKAFRRRNAKFNLFTNSSKKYNI